MRNSHIGIFDSGIGGLTVANEIRKVLPNENIIYFGDTKHLPYGEKSKEFIQICTKKIITFLISKKCKAIIIACNSASAVAEENLFINNKKIPVFNVIDPVINEISNFITEEKIGVIGTKATICSNIYKKKIRNIYSKANVKSLATPLLAPMIEEQFINEKISNTIIEKYLSNKKLNNIKHLILACTHYPLIYKEINNYYRKKVNVINSAKIVVKHIANTLNKLDLTNNSQNNSHHFYVSNYTNSFEKSANFFFNESIRLKEINLFS